METIYLSIFRFPYDASGLIKDHTLLNSGIFSTNKGYFQVTYMFILFAKFCNIFLNFRLSNLMCGIHSEISWMDPKKSSNSSWRSPFQYQKAVRTKIDQKSLCLVSLMGQSHLDSNHHHQRTGSSAWWRIRKQKWNKIQIQIFDNTIKAQVHTLCQSLGIVNPDSSKWSFARTGLL